MFDKKKEVPDENYHNGLRKQKVLGRNRKRIRADGDCMHVVNICPDVTYQTFHGFGGALTEAAAHVYAGMSKEKQDEIIEAYFGK